MNDSGRCVPLLAVFCALFLTAAGCTNNPATGGSMFSLVSENEERAIGAEHHPEILNEYGLYEELPRINAYVAMVSARILAASDISSQVLTVTVLDTDVVNAFALPGGYIYVTRGLLALANNEAELAGVIGHEIGHVAARHTAQRLTWARVAEIAVTVVDASTSHLDYGGLATDLSGLTAHAVIAGFSREQEIESDTLGVRYLARAGYDPYAMATFLRQLERHSDLLDALSPLDRDPSFLTRWFATHPRAADRVVLAADEARSSADTRILNRESYLRMIDGIAHGERADQGRILERRFEHPEWRFAFDVPEGLAMFRVNGQVRAYDDAGTLVTFDGVEDIHRGATPHLYRWADELRVRVNEPEVFEVAGFQAAGGRFRASPDGTDRLYRMVAIALNPGRVARFLFSVPAGEAGVLDDLAERTLASFRRLSADEAEAAGPLRVRVVEVAPGDTVDSLSRMMAFEDHRRERFLVLNGFEEETDLAPGMLVKVVRLE